MDKPNAIHKSVIEQMTMLTVEGAPFDGFRIYPEMPTDEPIQYPCFLITREGCETVLEFMGGGCMEVLHVMVQLAFFEKSGQEDSTEKYSMERLVYKYRRELKKFYDELHFDPALNTGEIVQSTEPKVPQNTMDNVWGCSLVLSIIYEED